MNYLGNLYRDVYNIEESVAAEFYSYVEDLLNNESVKKLGNFAQHLSTSRLQHSINVAFCAFVICKKLGLDAVSAARAGILHDLYLYDWRVEKQPEGTHAFAHPKVALRNAKALTTLNPIEEDAILSHMWPLCRKVPAYKESVIVSLADKYCACVEVSKQLTDKTRAVFRGMNYPVSNNSI